MWVYFSLCRSLGDLLGLFSSHLGLSGLKQVWVPFLWEKWQLFSLIRYISRFLGACCTRFETETQNSEVERTIALNALPGSRASVADSHLLEHERAQAGVGIVPVQGAGWGWHRSRSVPHRAPGSLGARTLPNKTASCGCRGLQGPGLLNLLIRWRDAKNRYLHV